MRTPPGPDPTGLPASGPDDRAPILSVEDLCVGTKHGHLRLVDGVSIDLGAGESVGLVGESGCGKTLTVLAMAGLLPDELEVQAGTVRYRNAPVTPVSPPPLGSGIGFVFQDPAASLTPVLRVGDQISEVVRIVAGATVDDANRRTAELLQEVGVQAPDAARRYPSQLSGGEKQRICIALALAADPDVLIADEPTTGVDVIVQAQILELLARLGESRGMSLVLVSHDLAVVSEVCERVHVLYAGQVVEAGPVGEVLSDPRHPYTRGLVDCMPTLGGADPQMRPIPGVVPAPGRWPVGCRFAPRCPHVEEACGELPPPVEAGGRTVRCWLNST